MKKTQNKTDVDYLNMNGFYETWIIGLDRSMHLFLRPARKIKQIPRRKKQNI